MGTEGEVGAVPPQPWLVRHGLLVGVVLAAAALLGVLAPAEQPPAPYGVAGCRTAPGAGPVDVTVSARALTAAGSPAAALGGGAAGSGPEVGASVRDLDGYAATGVAPCGVVQIDLHLHRGAAGGTVAGSLQRAREPVAVSRASGGGGRLVAVDWSSWAASLPAGTGAGDLEERATWFVTLVDAVPGTYRLTGRVTASGQPRAAGDVEVLVEVLPTDGR